MEIMDQYERQLLEFASKCTVKVYSPEENLRIIQNLNDGLEDFLYEQRSREKESEIELAGVILNA